MRWKLAAAAVLAAAGALLLVLTVDVNRWRTAIAAGDAGYAVDPARRGLWSTSHLLPGDPAASLLGVRDDVRARLAFRAFVLGEPRRLVFLTPVRIVQARAVAQVRLARASDLDREPVRRSRELELAGILHLIDIDPFDPGARSQSLLQAAVSFRSALAADPDNADAAADLELALRLLQAPPQSGRPQNGTGGPSASSRGSVGGY